MGDPRYGTYPLEFIGTGEGGEPFVGIPGAEPPGIPVQGILPEPEPGGLDAALLAMRRAVAADNPFRPDEW